MVQKVRVHCHACDKKSLVRALFGTAKCPHCGAELPVEGEDDLDEEERKQTVKRKRQERAEAGGQFVKVTCWSCQRRWKEPYRGSAFGAWMIYLFGGNIIANCPRCNKRSWPLALMTPIVAILQFPVLIGLVLTLLVLGQDLAGFFGNIYLGMGGGLVVALSFGCAVYGVWELWKRI